MADINNFGEENDSSILWEKMRNADKNHKLYDFIENTVHWFGLNKNQTYQDLEKKLRQENFNTYLYCKKLSEKEKQEYYILDLKYEKEVEYECIYSCESKPYALLEVLKYWPTYEQNFEYLKEAGIRVLKQISLEELENLIIVKSEPVI